MTLARQYIAFLSMLMRIAALGGCLLYTVSCATLPHRDATAAQIGGTHDVAGGAITHTVESWAARLQGFGVMAIMLGVAAVFPVVAYVLSHRWKPTRLLVDAMKGKPKEEP